MTHCEPRGPKKNAGLTRLDAVFERAAEAGFLPSQLLEELGREVALEETVGVGVHLGGRVLKPLPQPLQLLVHHGL